ncbi:DUF2218 domain-containing protein [Deefgea tanakiae]|jgi:hypothetical protein|uniref:DUF2218 domain-containing protein n=1 Tax=Deefgea tanakiae TaxID=2865840 RepID=A0ABX8ZAA9_9NEIS|nr:DUF2218 domain-containing protein [Deefgea tanakiae]QZA78740.1 DUF2218 domain-containing protein [Deefgea tanakiae]
MLTSQATLSAEHADKVLYKLCKHFALKIPVDFDTEQAHIKFPYGECCIQRRNEVLAMFCVAADEALLAKVEWVINDHLGLMVKNSALQLEWQRVTA